jgi:hypothetical protein
MATDFSRTYIKDLAALPWNTSPRAIVWRPTLQDSSTETRVAWSFDFAEFRRSFPEYIYNSYVVCGIRIRPSIVTRPPGDEAPAHIYSVFLRKNNLSVMGIPGDFSMAAEGCWAEFSYPLPVYFLSTMRPMICVEREMTRLEMRQMRPRPEPVVEILAHRVEDISASNYVFVMMNGLNREVVVRNIFADNKLFTPEYFQGSIPGPLKVIPSWGLIRGGWAGTEIYSRGGSLENIHYLSNKVWFITGAETEAEAQTVRTDLPESN